MKYIAILLLLALGACSTTSVDTEVALPELVSYSKNFRAGLADDVDAICGNAQKMIPAKHPYACTFLQDHIELRKVIKEMKK